MTDSPAGSGTTVAPARSGQFSMDVVVVDDVARVALSGELDLMHADWLRTELERVGEVPHLVVDLSELTFLDSIGTLVLERCRRLAVSRGVRMRLVAGPRHVQRMLRLCGVEASFEFVDEDHLGRSVPS